MRCLTVFALFMWLLVVSRSSDYWLCISPRVTLKALVDVEVCLGIPSCVTRWVPCGSRGLILGSTGRGRPLLYPASVFPTYVRPCIRGCSQEDIKTLRLEIIGNFQKCEDSLLAKAKLKNMSKESGPKKYNTW